MDKQTLRTRLEGSAMLLLQQNSQHCFNQLVTPCLYTVAANVKIPGKHLNAQEIDLLARLNKYEGRIFSTSEIVDLLGIDGKVPAYIDMCVTAAKEDGTIIHLTCSRRLRRENEISKNGIYPPFNPAVAQPPDFLRIGNGKYDINWGPRFDALVKPAGFFSRIKGFVGA